MSNQFSAKSILYARSLAMSKLERILMCVILVFIAVSAIALIGKEYFAFLAVFDLIVGVVIGMTIFMQNRGA